MRRQGSRSSVTTGRASERGRAAGLADTYLNLNRGCLSVRSAAGASRGRVWGYAAAVEISEARFVVQAGGRQRVLRNRCKDVHAWVRGSTRVIAEEGRDVGRLLARWQEACARGEAVDVAYNPFYTETFVRRTTAEPVFLARRVVIIGRRIFAVDI